MHKKGFTMLELLLSVAIISLVTAVSYPLYYSLQSRNDLSGAAEASLYALRRAQLMALQMESDSDWGVKIQSGGVTLFRGSAYDSRDSNYDETFDLPTTISLGGIGEIYYTKLTGTPSTTGNVNFTSTINNETATISINAMGVADIQ